MLEKYDVPVPRYTSFPPATHFYPLASDVYVAALASRSQRSLSLYLHIPFCRSMCLFCACSVVLNRSGERQERYVQALLHEIDLLPFSRKEEVVEVHFGGGTPTSLTIEQMERILFRLSQKFSLQGTLSIEIDPRTVWEDRGEKLSFLREKGFSRVSFGVQDFSSAVQEAVRRRQSQEISLWTYEEARRLGFLEVNLDLIYGLPQQTVESFAKTIRDIIALSPEQISLFSYASVPHLKPHQKVLKDFPSREEKFQIYRNAREALVQAGYIAIGMDHFAKPQSALGRAYRERKLYRNFQGYSVCAAEEMVGLGLSSIGFVQNGFFQNTKSLDGYLQAIGEETLPIERGYLLQEEDILRRYVLQEMLCHFRIEKRNVEEKFLLDFDTYFAKELASLEDMEAEGLLERGASFVQVTPLGEMFVRNIAARFDPYACGMHHAKGI